MRISIYEACHDDDRGSIGAWYVAKHAERAGYAVDLLQRPKKGYEIELISLHHCVDFERLAILPRHAPIRIVGGHPMQNNPRPAIPFADAICVGEGESWIEMALPLLDKDRDVHALRDLPGTIISEDWRYGQEIPRANHESPLPDNPPYLNRPGTRSAAWYMEIARGCPYSCAFCELGHSSPFRLYSKEQIGGMLDQADTSITRKINFYAPDEASHPDYPSLFIDLKKRGYNAGFSSMRIDSIMRRGLPEVPKNTLIRVGIDGLCEETRKRVNKNITDQMTIDYFQAYIDRGHVQFKMFMIFGYPWEALLDFEAFENLMRRLFSLRLSKNISLRIKWTPFIPQPCTPLGGEKSRYDFRMVDKINVWHALNNRPRVSPGWYIENDGLMSQRSHRRQCELTAGDDTTLLRFPGANVLHSPLEKRT